MFDPDFVTLRIDELETYLVSNKIVAFRLSEGEQETGAEEHEHEGEAEEA